MSESLAEKLNRARTALEKDATYGPRVDLDAYILHGEDPGIRTLAELPEDHKDAARAAGIVADEAGRSGTFFQTDHSVICASTKQSGLAVMSTTDARGQYPWVDGLLWEAVQPDADKYTAVTALDPTSGYFVRTEPGVKTTWPVQACLFIGRQDLVQRVHNVIVAEEDSELHIITGCTTAPDVHGAMHIGVSEFFVRRGATITFTMVHNWAPEVYVRPRTGIILEEGATFISNYISLREVDSLQMYPTAYLRGRGARVRFSSVIYGLGTSRFDIGARAVLEAPDSRAEILSRVIADDRAEIVARGALDGRAPDIKGHLECQGLLVSNDARIIAIPELAATRQDVDLSHEAAVGRIAEEEIQYLMARGIDPDEATSLIVRGFLNVDIEGLPPDLEAETRRLMDRDLAKIL